MHNGKIMEPRPSGSRGYRCTPGSSSNCVDEAGPRVFQSRSAHTTFLSGVISINCTVYGHSDCGALPAQLLISVFPLARRETSCTVYKGMPGRSSLLISQTVSPFGFTSLTQPR